MVLEEQAIAFVLLSYLAKLF